MNHKKKLFSWVLALALSASLVPALGTVQAADGDAVQQKFVIQYGSDKAELEIGAKEGFTLASLGHDKFPAELMAKIPRGWAEDYSAVTPAAWNTTALTATPTDVVMTLKDHPDKIEITLAVDGTNATGVEGVSTLPKSYRGLKGDSPVDVGLTAVKGKYATDKVFGHFTCSAPAAFVGRKFKSFDEIKDVQFNEDVTITLVGVDKTDPTLIETVTFDKGAFAADNQVNKVVSVQNSKKFGNIAPTFKAKDGFVFVGFTDGTDFYLPEAIAEIEADATLNRTYTAKYAIKNDPFKKFKLTFLVDGAGSRETEKDVYVVDGGKSVNDLGKTIVDPLPAVAYKFVGWSTTVDGAEWVGSSAQAQWFPAYSDMVFKAKFEKDSSLAKQGWKKVGNSKRFYVDGVALVGLHKNVNGGSTAYLFDKNGDVLYGWQLWNGYAIYLDETTGGLLTGVRLNIPKADNSGEKAGYLFTPLARPTAGKPLTGWHVIYDNKYYFDADKGGEMTTGLVKVGKGTYYFATKEYAAAHNVKEGTAQAGTVKIGDKVFQFSKSGLLLDKDGKPVGFDK